MEQKMREAEQLAVKLVEQSERRWAITVVSCWYQYQWSFITYLQKLC